MVRVLIVDDSMFMRQVLKEILPKDKFEVVGEAVNGREGIAKFKELNPDLVTLDITMPEIDGLEALKVIIGLDSDAKVIMCSAMGQKPMIRDAIMIGALDFIVKPFSKDQVLKVINNYI